MSESRDAYRSLADPARLLGLTAAQWLILVGLAAAIAGWLELGLLPTRLSITVAALAFGLPAGLAFLWQGEGLPVRIVIAGVRRRGLRGRSYGAAGPRGPRHGIHLDEGKP